MKKFLFLTFFVPSFSYCVCTTYNYTISDKTSGYLGSKKYICDNDSDKPLSGLTMGEKAYIKSTGAVYFATSSTGWAVGITISTEIKNVNGIRWADGTVQTSSPSLLDVLSLSSASVTYLQN